MRTLTITRHFGRLGNNMNYITQAIDYCLKHNINKLVFNKPVPGQNHQIGLLIKGIDIIINEGNDSNEYVNENHWGHYFYKSTLSFIERKELIQKFIVPNLLIIPKNINQNDLVIHLRGGDIFSRGHYAYIQPPISFYKKIIEKQNWNNIYLVSEDNKNPCFDILKETYNCISCLDNDNRHGGNYWGFSDDISLMLGSTHFVASKSSLSPLIIQLSKTIKNVYLCDFFIDEPSKRNQSKSQEFEKNENQIWWSNDFKNKKKDFKYNDIKIFVYDYSDYIIKFNKNNFDLSKQKNNQLMIIN